MTIQPPVIPRPALLRLLCALTLAVSALVLSHPPAAAAAAFTVTKTTDSKDDVCNRDCSLREAIIAAHRSAGVDTITLPAGLYRVTLSDLDITSSLTIVGAGAAATIIESNGGDRVVEVRPDTTVTIRNVTIRNGTVSAANGAGILNNGTLTLSESVVSGNRSQDGRGGGISNAGALTLNNSTVSGNAAHSGGGIENTAAGRLTVSASTISNNTAAFGGGLFTQGTAQLAQSVVRSNSGQVWAGGIYTSGDLALSNSTVSDNRLPALSRRHSPRRQCQSRSTCLKQPRAQIRRYGVDRAALGHDTGRTWYQAATAIRESYRIGAGVTRSVQPGSSRHTPHRRHQAHHQV